MSDTKTKRVACPTCGKPVAWGPESPYRPFCSERCRLIDLGEWIKEERRIPGQDLPPTFDDDPGWNG
ncbi:DNA gyrase inhibitor YacG [Endothiovibrio diazotrophicus]